MHPMRQPLEDPRSVCEIHDRVLEISFNAASWMGLASIGMLLKFTEEGLLPRERFGRFRFHVIEASNQLQQLPSSSKLNNYRRSSSTCTPTEAARPTRGSRVITLPSASDRR
jgi:hypothetical protein